MIIAVTLSSALILILNIYNYDKNKNTSLAIIYITTIVFLSHLFWAYLSSYQLLGEAIIDQKIAIVECESERLENKISNVLTKNTDVKIDAYIKNTNQLKKLKIEKLNYKVIRRRLYFGK